MKYPLAMTTDSKRAKSKMKKMKPDAFLKRAHKLVVGEGDRDIIDKFKTDIKGGEPMGPLKLYKDGTEDGRHRATAAKELGVDEVPVIDERTAKALGGALASTDPNKFMQDVLKFSFQILPLLRPGYLKEVPKQGFAHGGHVLEDDYPTHYLPEVGRQVMADGGSPRFAAMDPSALVGTSPQPFRGGEAYTDAGGLEVSSPYVSGMSGGYPVFDLGDKPTPKTPDLPGGKNPFEDWLQFNWLSKLMGRAEGGEVEGDVQFAPEDVEKALMTAREVAQNPRPFEEEKKYGEFGILPLRTEGEKVIYDPAASSMTEFVKHAFTPKISPTEIAKGAYDLGKGALESAYSGLTATGDVLSGKLDPMSNEGVKRALDLAGLVTGGSFGTTKPVGALSMGAAREGRITNPLGMHSAGAEAARALPQEKGTPEQVLAMLRKIVPEHEIEHSGIAKEIAGLSSISREDVAKHFEGKLPQIQETVFGGEGASSNFYSPGRPFSPEFEEHHDAFMHNHADDFAEEMFGERYQDLDAEQARDIYQAILEHSIETALEENVPIHQAEEGVRPMSKFEQYSLPGGSNYREVVLHQSEFPKPEVSVRRTPKGSWEYLVDGERAGAIGDPEGTLTEERALDIARLGIEKSAAWKRALDNKNKLAYSSSHFPEVQDYLAHMRMKDYDLPEGGKGLLVDELQSDRAQQGRKKGFRTAESDAQADRIAAQINDVSQQKRDLAGKVHRAYKEWEANELDAGRRPLPAGDLREQAVRAGVKDTYDQLDTLDNLEKSLHQERNKIQQGIALGPYMADTHHWTDLTLKRALKEAIEGGYDRLMITPGKEHADRYNMRKSVDSITYSPDTEHLIVTGKNGQRIYDQSADADKLEDLIGKELAKRLIESEPVTLGNMRMHSLHGEGLEVGGHGMKGFYDKTVPRRLDKLIKKYDKKAKIEPFDLDTGKGTKTVHSIPITPEMKAAFEEKGISAFRKGGTVKQALDVVRRGDAR